LGIGQLAFEAQAAFILGGDVRCTFNHDANIALGRTMSGACKI
jgi:phage head maturation protease